MPCLTNLLFSLSLSLLLLQSDWVHYEPISYAHSASAGGSQVQQVVGGGGSTSAAAAAVAAVSNVIRNGRAVVAAAAQAAGDAAGTAGSGIPVDPRVLHLSASASLSQCKCGIHMRAYSMTYIPIYTLYYMLDCRLFSTYI